MSEVDYRPRSGWTSTARGGALMVATDLRRLGWVDHYTGAPTVYGRMTVAQEAAALRSIRRHHVQVRGWSDIGYLIAFTQSGRVWDLRGISRVPAAHASPSNPRANWHGGAGLWLIGADEEPTEDITAAARDFRHRVWLPRWPMATGRLGHGDVPGAATSCPGRPVVRLLRDGTLLLPMEDDMPYNDWPDADRKALLDDIADRVSYTRSYVTGAERSSARVQAASAYKASHDTRADVREKVLPELRAVLAAVTDAADAESIIARVEELAAEGAAERADLAELVQRRDELGADAVVDEIARRLAGEEDDA